jgi:hypothetical protein
MTPASATHPPTLVRAFVVGSGEMIGPTCESRLLSSTSPRRARRDRAMLGKVEGRIPWDGS